MVIEKRPVSPVPKTYVPGGFPVPYKVNTGDSWDSVAAKFNIKVWELIAYNFPTIRALADFQQKSAEVNWYMRVNMGCTKSNDGKNYSFSTTDNPGLVYIPIIPKPPQITSHFVPRTVRRVAQPTDKPNVCWAAAATAMMSWKERKNYRIEEAMAKADIKWLIRYLANRGLPFKPLYLNYAFARDCGMNAAPFPCADPYTWLGLIETKGPVAVSQYNAKDWDHMVVLYGVFIVDSTATMYVMDPAWGTREKIPFKKFNTDYNSTFRGGTKPSLWFFGSPFLPIGSLI